MKRTISGLLAFLLVLSLMPAFPLTAQAADIFDLNNKYAATVSDGGAVITDYWGTVAEFVIPSTIGGYPVVGIGPSVFAGSRQLTSVTIPDSVTSIGDSAFGSCTSLKNVYIADLAAWCEIQFGNSGANPLSNGANLYLDDALVCDLVIPDSVTGIDDYAFYNCESLTSVTIPDSVTSIGDYAFYNCDSLTSVTISESVTSIGDSAFNDCSNLTSVTIPDSVTSIGDFAFNDCSNLTSVTIPDSVTSIGHYAFYYCTSLKNVYISDLAAWCEILFGGSTANPLCNGANLYLDDALVCDLVIPDSVTSIDDNAFYNCDSLTSVSIPDSVASIGDSAFRYCDSLTSVTIPDSVTGIGDSAFYCCKNLTSITIPESVTSIGDSAFRYCDSLTSVTIPDSVTGIGDSAFYCCKNLTSITIPESVTSIGDYAFYNCDSLTSVTIPEGMTSIEEGAFLDCFELKYVNYSGYWKDRQEMSIGPDNEPLINAQWSYAICPGEHTFDNACDTNCNICNQVRRVPDHIYDNACDTTCNICGRVRSVPCHVYSNACDTTCNVCGDVRSITHTYDNDCDTDCNVCGDVRTITHTYDNVCDAVCNICANVRTDIHVHDNSCDTDCNVCGDERTITHTYDDICDADCNICGNVRTDIHVFDNACDTTCNICGHVRSVPDHVYDNACDTTCNVCRFVRTVGEHLLELNGGLTCSICKHSNPPVAPTVRSVTSDSLTLVGMEWLEYSIDGFTWQDTPTFSGLKNNTRYTFYQRVKASDTASFSGISDGLSVCFRVYSASYDANGGENAPAQQFALYPDSLTLPTDTPTRDGFQFAGWGTKESCGRQYAPGDLLTAGSDITFYALWAEHCTECAGEGKISQTSSCSCDNGYVSSTTSHCSSCGFSNCITSYQGGYGSSGTKCRICGGINTGYYTVSTSKHSTCDGTGVIVTYKTCTVCRGSGTNDPSLPAPIILSFTDTTVTLRQLDGCEYSKDGITWQKSNVFSGLSPATWYTFYCRVGATAAAPFGLASKSTGIKTDKALQTALPPRPVAQEVTATSVVLKVVDGCEYSTDGLSWQSSPTFTGLSVATGYTFYQRYAETSTAYAGNISASLSVRTDKGTQDAPSAPTLSGKTYNRVELVYSSGLEYSMDGVTWQESNVFTGLNPSTNYLFYCRWAETDFYYSSEASTSLIVRTENSPAFIPGDVTGDSKVNMKDWQRLYEAISESSPLTEEAAQRADVTGDGKVNIKDWHRLYQHISEIAPL